MTLLNNVKRLPQGFVWGGAMAAYQVEGSVRAEGRGACMWDAHLEAHGGFSPEPACDFYHRYSTDIALASEYGMNALRISISWTRIFPDGDPGKTPNEAGVTYYHKVFACCLDQGITPYVSLHHFDSPQANCRRGDWLDADNLDRFVGYAAFCFCEYREVTHWFTFNEPITLVLEQYVLGGFPPCHQFDFPSCMRAQHNLLMAHARAVNLYKERGLSGKIGIVHVLKPAYPLSERPEDAHAAEVFDALYNRVMLDGTLTGAYGDITRGLIDEVLGAHGASFAFDDKDRVIMREAAAQIDMMGVNYYQNMFTAAHGGESEFHHNGAGDKGALVIRFAGVGQVVRKRGVPTTDWDWNIFPQGLTDSLLRIKRDYPSYPELLITENGVGLREGRPSPGREPDDSDRIAYLDEHVRALLSARERGVNVQGYFAWSLQDQFSWTNGYDKRYGLFYVDFDTQERTAKKSARWFRELGGTMRRSDIKGVGER